MPRRHLLCLAAKEAKGTKRETFSIGFPLGTPFPIDQGFHPWTRALCAKPKVHENFLQRSKSGVQGAALVDVEGVLGEPIEKVPPRGVFAYF